MLALPSKILNALPQEAWVALAVAAVMLLGFVTMIRQQSRRKQQLAFAIQYRNKFIEYANSRGADTESYRWLTLKANQIQSDMGDTGVYAGFRPPFENVIYKNYPIVLNMVPRIRQMMDDNGMHIWDSQISAYVNAVDEAFLRHIGPQQDSCEQDGKQIANPLRWFRSGIEQILSVPLYLLSLFGLMGIRTIAAIQAAPLFRVLAGLAGLISFIGAIIGLLVDWSEAREILKHLWEP